MAASSAQRYLGASVRRAADMATRMSGNPLLNDPTYDSIGSSLTADTLESGSPAFGA